MERQLVTLGRASRREPLTPPLAAGILLQERRPTAALLKLETAPAGPAPAWMLAGAAYLERARVEDSPFDLIRALDALARATEARPDSPAAWFDLGLAASKLHLCRTAETSLRAALARETDDAWRSETRSRLRAAACPERELPRPTLAPSDDAALGALELDRLFEQGDFEEIVHRSSAALSRHPSASLRGRLCWMRGTAEMALGRLGDALDSFGASLAAYEAARDLPRQGAVHSLLASAYSVAGDAAASWRHRRRALALLQQTGWRDRLNVALNALAYEAYDEGSYAAANLILAEIGPSGDVTATKRATIGLYRARALAAQGRAEAATELLDELAPAERDSRLAPEQLGLLQLRAGETLRLVGRHRDALATLTAAVHSLEQRGERLILVEALAERARVELALADMEAARADLAAARRQLVLERASLDVLQRPAFLDASARIADLAVAVELRSGDTTAALERLEEGTAQTLGDLLTTRRPSPGVAAIPGPPAAPPDVVTLRYGVLDEELLVWRFRAGTTRLFRVPIGKRELRKLALDVAASLREATPAAARATLERLGRLLLGDLNAENAPARVLVVPDDALHAVPFGALRLVGGGHLIEHSEVQLAPSLALALASSDRVLARRDLASLWVADASSAGLPSLRAARQAVTRAQTAYSAFGPATLLVGSLATRGQVLRALADARLAEIDVHSSSTAGFLGSVLHLAASAPRESAALRAETIAELDLANLQLAVLASCDSSNSRYRGSEGIGGLQWAFLAAGTGAVVSTLWEVDDDAAARFTARLHAHLLAGRSLAAATRLAAVDSMRAGDTAWPAFVHHGADVRLAVTD